MMSDELDLQIKKLMLLKAEQEGIPVQYTYNVNPVRMQVTEQVKITRKKTEGIAFIEERTHMI